MRVNVRCRALVPVPDPRGMRLSAWRMADRQRAVPERMAGFRSTPACHSRPDRKEEFSPRPGRLRARVVECRWGQDPDGDARNRGLRIAARETEHGWTIVPDDIHPVLQAGGRFCEGGVKESACYTGSAPNSFLINVRMGCSSSRGAGAVPASGFCSVPAISGAIRTRT